MKRLESLKRYAIKRPSKSFVTRLIIVLVACYLLLTPTGSIRVAILVHGDPVAAVTARLRLSEPEDVTDSSLENPSGSIFYGRSIYTVQPSPYDPSNVPQDPLTGAMLTNWVSYHILCFHVAGYYGYC